MKRHMLAIAVVLTISTIATGDVLSTPCYPLGNPLSDAIGLLHYRLNGLPRLIGPLANPTPPSTVWSRIGDGHAAVPPPVPVVVERPSGFGDCVCDRFTELYRGDFCPFCGRHTLFLP